tara:strand:- start:1759 stop:1926 length:168 start_codon:yes stop_codon:yes gene_type:complete
MRAFAEKLLSRKLLAVIVAGAAVWLGIVTGDQFQQILMAYLGAQGLTDAAAAFKS